MIDKILLKLFGYIDDVSDMMQGLIFPKPKPKNKRKKKVCKDCKCGCHCKDDLHLHFGDQELCTCGKCKCTKK